jgi:hypothetical protein
MTGNPGRLNEQAQAMTGLKVQGIELYPSEPSAGKTLAKPLPRPF